MCKRVLKKSVEKPLINYLLSRLKGIRFEAVNWGFVAHGAQ
jgi:hypothetical protein